MVWLLERQETKDQVALSVIQWTKNQLGASEQSASRLIPLEIYKPGALFVSSFLHSTSSRFCLHTLPIQNALSPLHSLRCCCVRQRSLRNSCTPHRYWWRCRLRSRWCRFEARLIIFKLMPWRLRSLLSTGQYRISVVLVFNLNDFTENAVKVDANQKKNHQRSYSSIYARLFTNTFHDRFHYSNSYWECRYKFWFATHIPWYTKKKETYENLIQYRKFMNVCILENVTHECWANGEKKARDIDNESLRHYMYQSSIRKNLQVYVWNK